MFSLCALCYFFLLFYYDFLLFFHVASFILRCSYSCTISIHKAKQQYTQHLMKPFIHLYKLKALTRSLAFANWFVLPPAVQVKWKQRFFSTVSASAVIVVVVIVMCIIYNRVEPSIRTYHHCHKKNVLFFHFYFISNKLLLFVRLIFLWRDFMPACSFFYFVCSLDGVFFFLYHTYFFLRVLLFRHCICFYIFFLFICKCK